uniref:Uncharacterized protein n=1 Tax=Anguilla anguilla TaxID=7936 RepID=A0A0E9WAF0_ANGAN
MSISFSSSKTQTHVILLTTIYFVLKEFSLEAYHYRPRTYFLNKRIRSLHT